MLKAKLTGKDDKPIYLIGLSYRNLELMKEGKPAMIDLNALHGEGQLFIFSGSDEAAMVRMLEEQGFDFPKFEQETNHED